MSDDLPVTQLPAPDRASADPESTRARSTDPAATTDATAGLSTDHPLLAAGRDLPAVPGYAVTREIARGGMGRVLAARDLALDRPVAIKMLLPGAANDEAAARFVTESKVTAQLPHPNIPPVYALGALADGSPFLAMKLVEGSTLAALLKERASPADDLPRFVGAFEQVCLAVGFAHSRGVIHRDLKPANVMVGAFGEVQVMDWGLAKQVSSGQWAVGSEDKTGVAAPQRDASETVAGQVMGTPAYMPPEQARGEAVDCRADVFALGAVLCEVLTGARPFTGKTSAEVVARAAAGDVADALARLGSCGADAELIALATHCLAPAAAARPADGKAVADAVAAYRVGVEARLRTAERERAAAGAKAVEQRKRRRVQLALAAAVALLVFAGGAFGWWQDRQAGEGRRQQSAFDAEQARLTEERGRERAEADARAARADGERRVERVRAEAAEGRARASVDAGVALAAVLRTAYRFEEADAALRQAAVLIPAGGPSDLRDRLRRAADDLALVRDLDAIRTGRSAWIADDGGKGHFDEAGAPAAYATAFQARGLDVNDGPAVVAARVRASAVAADLVAALDDWAVFEPDEAVRVRVLAVARAADPGPWLDRFRDPAVRTDPARCARLAAEADPAALEPGTVTALAELMVRRGQDPGRLLAASQFTHPGDFLVTFALGQLYFHFKRDRAAAVAHYLAARAIRPAHFAVVTNLGISLSSVGDRDAALRCFREASGLRPKDPQAHFNLGSELARSGDRAGAILHFLKAIDLDKGYAKAHYNLAIAYVVTRDYDRAEASFRAVLRLTPDDAAAHNNLAVLLGKRGDWNGELEHFEEAVRLDPGNPMYMRSRDLARKLKPERDARTAPPPREVPRP